MKIPNYAHKITFLVLFNNIDVTKMAVFMLLYGTAGYTSTC